MNLGIILDSASGLTSKQAEQKGWYFLPLHFFINEKDYRDGIDITKANFYKNIDSHNEIKTSASYLGEVEEIVKKASKKHDQVIIYTISKNLSSQNANVLSIAKKYKNVKVIPSKAIGPTIVNALEKAEQMSKENYTIDQIMQEIELFNDSNFGFLVPKTLEWLVKGGRVSPAIASMAKLLKIVPIIMFKEGNLERFGKGRIFEKTIIKVANHAIEMKKNNEQNYKWYIMHSGSKEVNSINDKLKNTLSINADTIYLPPVIGSHVGPGAICIFLVKK